MSLKSLYLSSGTESKRIVHNEQELGQKRGKKSWQTDRSLKKNPESGVYWFHITAPNKRISQHFGSVSYVHIYCYLKQTTAAADAS